MVDNEKLPEFVQDAVDLGFPVNFLENGETIKDSIPLKSFRFIAVSVIRSWANVQRERVRELPYSDENFDRFKKLGFIVSRADLALEELCPT